MRSKNEEKWTESKILEKMLAKNSQIWWEISIYMFMGPHEFEIGDILRDHKHMIVKMSKPQTKFWKQQEKNMAYSI